MPQNTDAESIVRDIKRRTRKKYSSEENIRMVLEGLRGEASVAELCRSEGLNTNIYYKWSKQFLEAGKKRLHLDIISRRERLKRRTLKARKHYNLSQSIAQSTS